ncbi:leucine-rich repeat-containing protein 74A [Biomphalaria pfeifferi]|uniref:Leucine-rich repeat-containing protein 74A n=1 Tax=Biomphalaria pfeifferi TaxID=112525 RepID=A0AAD8BSP7_BIOPF|nr:leucine-rich repeat-containing protein 74A [Biomphalaria pfeifferi]
MATFFDPVSVAIETLKTIEGVSLDKKDPVRFKIMLPTDPGTWAKESCYKLRHNILKWSNLYQKKVTRAQRQIRKLRMVASISLPTIHPKTSSLHRVHSSKMFSHRTSKAVEEQTEESVVELNADPSVSDVYFDEDHRDDEEEDELKKVPLLERNQLRYYKACHLLKCIPYRRVMRTINSFEVNLSTLKMTNAEYKAVMVCLMANDEVQRLLLSEAIQNDVQMSYLTDIFMEETQITDLVISNNNLQGKIVDRFFDLMLQTDNLVYLDISGNNLTDRDAALLTDYVRESSSLAYLYMSRNKFTPAVGDVFGKMIAGNASLVDLDISRNCIRLEGAEKFFRGLAKNTNLERLDFSWNGLGHTGFKVFTNMLKKNKTLEFVNLSGTRLNGKDLEKFPPILKKNTSLARIVLEHNNIQMSDITTFLTDVYKLKSTGLRRVDFGRYQTIEKNAAPLVDLLFWEKNIEIRYGCVMSHSDDKYNKSEVLTKYREDPLALVTKLKPEERMRLVKYFGGIDLEAAIDTGEDIHHESFLHKMRNNKVTFKDLANRIMEVGGDPNDVIRTSLEMSQVADPDARVVARYSISANLARRLYLKSRIAAED